MSKIPVIAIFDVGKTNKKLLLFNEQYKLLHEESCRFKEIADEDDFPCEDIVSITEWIKNSFRQLLTNEQFEIKGVNFSAYGATFVYLDEDLKLLLPMYNYLKPYEPHIQNKFYRAYGGESVFAKQTASPVLGNLNSGMQLYSLKYEKADRFKKIKYALHLPQYLSFILAQSLYSDITSIGCHTNLWNFQEHKYHDWLEKETILEKLAPLAQGDTIAGFINKTVPAGIGLHDSSAALVPYLFLFNEPFILISTGTWCISLNPFNHTLLTDYELYGDCLCYLSHEGNPIKASRLFAGYEHEQQVKKLSEHYNKPVDYFTRVLCNIEILKSLRQDETQFFHDRNLTDYLTYEEAYHQLMCDIMKQQVRSTNLVLRGTQVKRIFVDGGFSKNPIYMYLLAEAFPQLEVFAASVAQASALGAALVFHQHWNSKPFPSDIIDLKLYLVVQSSSA